MPKQQKAKGKSGAATVSLPGAEDTGPALTPHEDEGGPRQVIYNYGEATFAGGPRGGLASSDPVGPAADQCYRFEIVNNAIDPTWNANITANPGNCVYLASAVIEKERNQPGKATFVVCCEKQDDGKCKDCATTVTLTLTKAQRSVSKIVRIFCQPN